MEENCVTMFVHYQQYCECQIAIKYMSRLRTEADVECKPILYAKHIAAGLLYVTTDLFCLYNTGVGRLVATVRIHS